MYLLAMEYCIKKGLKTRDLFIYCFSYEVIILKK